MNEIIIKTGHVLQPADLLLTMEAEPFGDGQRISWRVSNTGETEFHGVLRLICELPSWVSQPWWMIPGFFYGDNKLVCPDEADKPAAWPQFDANVTNPARMVSSHWDFAADRSASPLVYLHDNDRCLALCAFPHYDTSSGCSIDEYELQVGMGFGFDGKAGYVRLSIPGTEEPFTYANSSQSYPTIRRITIPPGGWVSGTAYTFDFAGARHDYQKIMECYYNELAPLYPSAKPILEPTELRELMRDAMFGQIAHHYDSKANYFVYSRAYDKVNEQVANSRGFSLEWHQMNVGWVNGLPNCLSLAIAGRHLDNPEAITVATRVADRICREGISKSGLFYGDFAPGKIQTENGTFTNPLRPDGRDGWGSGWLQNPNCVHARTVADACYFLAGLIMELPTHESVQLWKSALLSNIEAVLKLQLPNGCYGNWYEYDTSQVVKRHGCGGIMWIPAMLHGKRVFADQQELLQRIDNSVRQAADGYARAVYDELIWGAPEDNDSASSEDGLTAVMAYCNLHEHFGDAEYLDLARRSADWLLTFRKTYNVRMHPLTLMGAYNMRSMGGDFASAANNHLHIFEVLVTRHLCQLSTWTGNDYYRKRALEHWAFVCQYLCRQDGQYNGFRGACSEQFYWSNYGSFGQDTTALEPDGFMGNWKLGPHHKQKGNICGFSTIWCISVMIHGAEAWGLL